MVTQILLALARSPRDLSAPLKETDLSPAQPWCSFLTCFVTDSHLRPSGPGLFPVWKLGGVQPLMRGPCHLSRVSTEEGNRSLRCALSLSPPSPAPPSGTWGGGSRGSAPSSFVVVISISNSDLYNWKTSNPPFSEKLQTLISLLETVFYTGQPTWDGCEQLLATVFTVEERDQILLQSRKLAR